MKDCLHACVPEKSEEGSLRVTARVVDDTLYHNVNEECIFVVTSRFLGEKKVRSRKDNIFKYVYICVFFFFFQFVKLLVMTLVEVRY